MAINNNQYEVNIKSTLIITFFKVSPLRYRQEGTLAVKSLILKDQKTTAKVCLFADNAELPFNAGDVVKVSAVYKKQYNQRAQLTSSPASVCEVYNCYYVQFQL